MKYRREAFYKKPIFGDNRRKRTIFEDRDNRLNGGNSDNGGLANVNYNPADNHWNNKSVRPLEVSK